MIKLSKEKLGINAPVLYFMCSEDDLEGRINCKESVKRLNLSIYNFFQLGFIVLNILAGNN